MNWRDCTKEGSLYETQTNGKAYRHRRMPAIMYDEVAGTRRSVVSDRWIDGTPPDWLVDD